MDSGSNPQSLSPSSMALLIAILCICKNQNDAFASMCPLTTLPGGAVWVAFAIYVTLRMRRGDTLKDIFKLRGSKRIKMLTQEAGNSPIVWETRYSIRSSRHPSRKQSMSLAARRERDLQPLPLPVTQRFNSRDAYYRWYWKERARPTTPVNVISNWFMKDATRSLTKTPDMVHLKEGHRASMGQSTVRHSFTTYKTARSSRKSTVPTVSVAELSMYGVEPPTPAASRERCTRWSFTNSEAPSTPRLNFETKALASSAFQQPTITNLEQKRSSSGSSQKRPVSTWVSYQMESIEEAESCLPSPMASSDALPTPRMPRTPHDPGLRTFFSAKS